MGQPQPRRFTRSDTLNWDRLGDADIHGGNLIERSSGYRMSAMRWQIASDATAPVPFPTDEAWIVLDGAVSITCEEHEVRAAAGEVMLVPRHLPGTAAFTAPTELVTVANPPSWELGPETEESTVHSSDPSTPWGRSRGPVLAGPTPTAVGDPGLVVEHAKVRAGTTLATPATALDSDEAVIVAAGAIEPTRGSGLGQATAGDLAYRPAGHSLEWRAVEGAELVLVRPGGTAT